MFENISLLYGVYDIIAELAKLSLQFQKVNLTPESVPACVDKLRDWLNISYCGSRIRSPSVEAFWRSLTIAEAGTLVEFKGHALSLGLSTSRSKSSARVFDTACAEVNAVLKEAAETVVTGLNARFPNTREVGMFTLLDVRRWPKAMQDMVDYGESGQPRSWLLAPPW